jgi:hypothetical protein
MISQSGHRETRTAQPKGAAVGFVPACVADAPGASPAGRLGHCMAASDWMA